LKTKLLFTLLYAVRGVLLMSTFNVVELLCTVQESVCFVLVVLTVSRPRTSHVENCTNDYCFMMTQQTSSGRINRHNTTSLLQYYCRVMGSYRYVGGNVLPILLLVQGWTLHGNNDMIWLEKDGWTVKFDIKIKTS
jgi:hypothetical protein